MLLDCLKIDKQGLCVVPTAVGKLGEAVPDQISIFFKYFSKKSHNMDIQIVRNPTNHEIYQ